MNYLELCPELERHGELFRVRLDPDVLEMFIARYDASLVTVELCHQFAVRCVRASAGAVSVAERFLPVSLRNLSAGDLRQARYLFGQVSHEPRGGTVQVFSSSDPTQYDDVFCLVTVMATQP